MTAKRRLRTVVGVVRIAGLLTLLAYRASALLIGLKLRSKYYAWRERRRFKKTLSRYRLPGDLAGRLAAMYSESITRHVRVPGPMVLFQGARRSYKLYVRAKRPS